MYVHYPICMWQRVPQSASSYQYSTQMLTFPLLNGAAVFNDRRNTRSTKREATKTWPRNGREVQEKWRDGSKRRQGYRGGRDEVSEPCRTTPWAPINRTSTGSRRIKGKRAHSVLHLLVVAKHNLGSCKALAGGNLINDSMLISTIPPS